MMRRLSGVLLAGAILLLPAFSQVHGAVFAQAAPQKTTFTGDMVLWAFSVNPDKVADYEQVLAKLKDALAKSQRPEAKQQLAGWKVLKNAMPNPDGSVVYVHTISPVVAGADYSITNIVYEATDATQRQAFYDMYKAAVKQALFVISGPVVSDFSK
jgi:hypothetical protein